MNNQTIKNLLMPFYFGSIGDRERLLVERNLLTDPETLVDYLEIKRKIESAETLPQSPSIKLWSKLKRQVSPRKKTMVSFSIGVAVAASVLVCWILFSSPKQRAEVSTNGSAVLFDSIREL